MTPLGAQTVGAVVVSHHLAVVRKVTTLPSAPAHHIGTVVFPQNPANRCGSAWKRDPGSGVIGVEKGPLIPLV